MANVGVTSDPTTMDEFIDLMVKFANNDPDKDGKNDTIGLTCYNASWLQWFMMSYEPGTNGWIKDSTGKWIPAFMTQNSLEGIKALKKLYDAGGLDKDFATLKGDEGRDKYASNVAGAYAHDATVSTIENYVGDQFEKVNPTLKYSDVVDLLKPFKSADGNYYRLISNPGWSETYINAKCDAAKVDRVMRLFDYILDTNSEGFRLTHFGIEGKDWNLVDGKVVLADYKDKDGKPAAPITQYPISQGFGSLAMWSGVYQATAPNAKPIYQQIFQANNDWLMANAKAQPINLVIPLLDVPDKDKATYNLSDVIIKCVLSSDAEKTWNDLMANYKANGYDKIIEEVNTAATAAGIQ
jgi:putative aldouronate transport system substrate-binding protein